MIKKVTTIIIIFLLIGLSSAQVFADEKLPPPPSSKNGNFGKGKFSQKNSWSKNNKALAPPNPNSDPWGTTVPISNGLVFLLIGSTLYIIKRIVDDKKETHSLN